VHARQLQQVRIDLGPGSYTGLRSAVTFVRFLQHFGALPVLAVDSLALMAARAPAARAACVRAVLDARRGRFHHGAFRRSAAGIAAQAPIGTLALPDLLAAIGTGDVVVLPAALAAQLGGELLARGAEVLPIARVTAKELFAPELPFVSVAGAELTPRYLAGSYAEP
jgi:tRNA threonylcarbamoyladenosine biosynthesis protein TsaB